MKNKTKTKKAFDNMMGNPLESVDELVAEAKTITEKYGKCSECGSPDDDIEGCETCHKPRSIEDEPEL